MLHFQTRDITGESQKDLTNEDEEIFQTALEYNCNYEEARTLIATGEIRPPEKNVFNSVKSTQAHSSRKYLVAGAECSEQKASKDCLAGLASQNTTNLVRQKLIDEEIVHCSNSLNVHNDSCVNEPIDTQNIKSKSSHFKRNSITSMDIESLPVTAEIRDYLNKGCYESVFNYFSSRCNIKNDDDEMLDIIQSDEDILISNYVFSHKDVFLEFRDQDERHYVDYTETSENNLVNYLSSSSRANNNYLNESHDRNPQRNISGNQPSQACCDFSVQHQTTSQEPDVYKARSNLLVQHQPTSQAHQIYAAGGDSLDLRYRTNYRAGRSHLHQEDGQTCNSTYSQANSAPQIHNTRSDTIHYNSSDTNYSLHTTSNMLIDQSSHIKSSDSNSIIPTESTTSSHNFWLSQTTFSCPQTCSMLSILDGPSRMLRRVTELFE